MFFNKELRSLKRTKSNIDKSLKRLDCEHCSCCLNMVEFNKINFSETDKTLLDIYKSLGCKLLCVELALESQRIKLKIQLARRR